MHPRMEDRRRAITVEKLAVMNAEYRRSHPEWDPVAEYVSHFEGKLPRPENYRKKSVSRLRNTLRNIDENLQIVSGDLWQGHLGEGLSAMYRKHREIALKELARRMVVKRKAA